MNVLKHHEEIYNQILSLIFLDEKKNYQNCYKMLLYFTFISLNIFGSASKPNNFLNFIFLRLLRKDPLPQPTSITDKFLFNLSVLYV